MYTKSFLGILLLAVPILLFSQDKAWITYNKDSLDFSVQVPETMKEVIKSSVTALGTQEISSFGVKPKNKNDKNHLYQIIIIQYPKNSIPADSLSLRKEILEDLAQQSVEEGKAELIYKEMAWDYGRSTIQWRIHFGRDISIKSKAFIHKSRVYILQVMSPVTSSLNENVDRFFDGFRLLSENK